MQLSGDEVFCITAPRSPLVMMLQEAVSQALQVDMEMVELHEDNVHLASSASVRDVNATVVKQAVLHKLCIGDKLRDANRYATSSDVGTVSKIWTEDEVETFS